MLKGKNILIGVSGGIAAYKAIELASMLGKEGANVKTILTQNTLEFVTELSFFSITKNKPSTDMFAKDAYIEHISLADWADIIVIAPATANIMAKAVGGIADDLLSSTILACDCPKLFIPAMNTKMYENAATQENRKILRTRGAYILEPASGLMACGTMGGGRYPDNYEVIAAISTYLIRKTDLKGKKILISAGANQEKIDCMRYITNKSSGKMGLAIARAAVLRGADVKLVVGACQAIIPHYIETVRAISAKEMASVCLELAKTNEIVIMTAAVANYTPAHYETQKIKKTGDYALEMVCTTDILKTLGKRNENILIGFAAESENIIANAKEKLVSKNLDYIVANDLSVAGADITEVSIINKTGKIEKATGDKLMVAHQILDRLL